MSDLKVAIAGAGGRMGGANIRAIAGHSGPRGPFRLRSRRHPGDRQGCRRTGWCRGPGHPHHRRRECAALERRRRHHRFHPLRPTRSPSPTKRPKRGLIHIIGTYRLHRCRRRGHRRGRRQRGAHRQGRQFLARAQPAARPRQAGRRGAAGLRHRNPRDAPQQEGRCPLRHRPDAGRSRGGRAQSRPQDPFGARARRPYRPTRSRQHRFCHAARRDNVIGEHEGDPRRPVRATKLELNQTSPITAPCCAEGAVRAALWARDQRPGLYSMADVLGFN